MAGLSDIWGVVGVVSILFGGSWAVSQTQFSNVDKQFANLAKNQELIQGALDRRSGEVDAKFALNSAELLHQRDATPDGNSKAAFGTLGQPSLREKAMAAVYTDQRHCLACLPEALSRFAAPL